MKIVIAPDSFKGSASSKELAQWIEDGIRSVIPDCEIVKVAIGDGGEGTLDAFLESGFSPLEVSVHGPTSRTVHAKFGMCERVAIIELAEASGLSQLPGGKLEPLKATSYGTGELIRAALDHGAEEIILALGGSACTDAGAGALQALGAKILDSSNIEISFGGAELARCQKLDLGNLDPRISRTKFIVASDVENPLLGNSGAARVYAAQKGALPDEINLLEDAIKHFTTFSDSHHVDTPGAGAAGGFGYMALTFLGAKQQSGIHTLLNLIKFEDTVADADLVITGEGSFDSQSLNGKAPMGVLEISSRHSIPVALICGQSSLNTSETIDLGFDSFSTLVSLEPDKNICMTNPGPIVEKIAAALAKTVAS